MKIDHRNTFTPTEIIKGGLRKVTEAIKKDSSEVFIIRSARAEEEMAIMSVEQAEQLLHIQKTFDDIIDQEILSEFHARKEKGFEAIEIEVDPNIVLTDEERYVPRRKRHKAGAL